MTKLTNFAALGYKLQMSSRVSRAQSRTRAATSAVTAPPGFLRTMATNLQAAKDRDLQQKLAAMVYELQAARAMTSVDSRGSAWGGGATVSIESARPIFDTATADIAKGGGPKAEAPQRRKPRPVVTLPPIVTPPGQGPGSGNGNGQANGAGNAGGANGNGGGNGNDVTPPVVTLPPVTLPPAVAVPPIVTPPGQEPGSGSGSGSANGAGNTGSANGNGGNGGGSAPPVVTTPPVATTPP
ncbi:MAG TPA: hypothetical protein VEA38_16360, partial [Terriglobales bacterium]|nr:hypothetical protein [Terriglobales bacterium]